MAPAWGARGTHDIAALTRLVARRAATLCTARTAWR